MLRFYGALAFSLLMTGCPSSAPEGPKVPWERAQFLLTESVPKNANRPDGVVPSVWKDLQVLRDESTRIGPFRIIQMTLSQG